MVWNINENEKFSIEKDIEFKFSNNFTDFLFDDFVL